jgi:hypothetical protein
VMRSPGSLAEVAEWSRAPGEFWRHLADFLDHFSLERRAAMLEDEPARLEGLIEAGEVADAYLAATAVSLARELGVMPPLWALGDDGASVLGATSPSSCTGRRPERFDSAAASRPAAHVPARPLWLGRGAAALPGAPRAAPAPRRNAVAGAVADRAPLGR